MQISVFLASATIVSIVSRIATGQPVYSDPPCSDSGWNCDWSLAEQGPTPASDQTMACPDCIQRFAHHDEQCVHTPGNGNYEFCGWPTFENVPDHFQRFECNLGNAAMGAPYCDPTRPVGNKWDSTTQFAFVVRYSGSRDCPPGDCGEVPR